MKLTKVSQKSKQSSKLYNSTFSKGFTTSRSKNQNSSEFQQQQKLDQFQQDIASFQQNYYANQHQQIVKQIKETIRIKFLNKFTMLDIQRFYDKYQELCLKYNHKPKPIDYYQFKNFRLYNKIKQLIMIRILLRKNAQVLFEKFYKKQLISFDFQTRFSNQIVNIQKDFMKKIKNKDLLNYDDQNPYYQTKKNIYQQGQFTIIKPNFKDVGQIYRHKDEVLELKTLKDNVLKPYIEGKAKNYQLDLRAEQRCIRQKYDCELKRGSSEVFSITNQQEVKSLPKDYYQWNNIQKNNMKLTKIDQKRKKISVDDSEYLLSIRKYISLDIDIGQILKKYIRFVFLDEYNMVNLDDFQRNKIENFLYNNKNTPKEQQIKKTRYQIFKKLKILYYQEKHDKFKRYEYQRN